MNEGEIWNGVTLQEDGSLSNHNARVVRKRLRILLTTDVQKLEAVAVEIQALQNKLSTLATMEFAVEDLTDPEKIKHDAEGTVGQSES